MSRRYAMNSNATTSDGILVFCRGWSPDKNGNPHDWLVVGIHIPHRFPVKNEEAFGARVSQPSIRLDIVFSIYYVWVNDYHWLVEHFAFFHILGIIIPTD